YLYIILFVYYTICILYYLYIVLFVYINKKELSKKNLDSIIKLNLMVYNFILNVILSLMKKIHKKRETEIIDFGRINYF
ncbi:hypothetical protein EB01_02752, partial [Enterococcus faecium]